MGFTVCRFHDISCGHRVFGHEGKCQHLHGHNYRIHFYCESKNSNPAGNPSDELDGVGRVIDFGAIKDTIVDWIELNWDHKFLVWISDPVGRRLLEMDPGGVVLVPFNPTAENIAGYLVEHVGPDVLKNTGVLLVQVTVEETRKCSATYLKED